MSSRPTGAQLEAVLSPEQQVELLKTEKGIISNNKSLIELAKEWTQFKEFIGDTPHRALTDIYLADGAAAFQTAATELKSVLKGKQDGEGHKLGALGDFDRWIKAIEREAKAEYKRRDAERKRAELEENCEYPDSTIDQNGRVIILPTSANFRVLLEQLGITVRLDIIANRIVIDGDLSRKASETSEFDALVMYCTDACIRARFQRVHSKMVAEWLVILADENRFNGVLDYLAGLPPRSGMNTMAQVFDCLGIVGVNRGFYFLMFTKSIVQAVALAHNNEDKQYKAEIVFTLQSELQGAGKSTFFRMIFHPVKKYYLSERKLDPNNKDSVIENTRAWGVELSEAGRTTRKESDALKGFLTAESDTYRAPYQRTSGRYVRHTTFFATVNNPDFLPEAGRRFVVVPLPEGQYIDLKQLAAIDMDNLWAEAYAIYQRDEFYWRLTAQEREVVVSGSEKFKMLTNEEILVRDSFRWDAEGKDWEWRSSSEVARELGINISANKVGRVLSSLEISPGVKLETHILHGVKQYKIPPYEDFVIC